jgi:hypothetical protein
MPSDETGGGAGGGYGRGPGSGEGTGPGSGSGLPGPGGTYIPQPDIFDSIKPDEIVLIAAIFAIFLASELSDDNASSLAFFFSTIGSNMGLYIDRRGRERIPAIPGVG